jgi:hypothetical protein
MRMNVLMVILIGTISVVGCHNDRRASPEGGSTPRTTSGTEMMDIEPIFRQHYDSHYAKTGYSYAQYRPAYRYGFDLASDSRNQNMEWATIERAALRGWDSSKMGEWEQYKDAVRYGWEVRRNK